MNMRNKKCTSLIVAILMMVSFVLPVQTLAENAKETVKLTVLGTSDLHGDINGWSYENGEDSYKNSGFARAATIVNQVREENPNTILLDNGDTVQGTILTDDLFNIDLESPHPVIAVMNYMKYDAMTLGNHEFNFGLELVEKMGEEATFPLLGANIYYKETGESFAKPYIVKEYDGVKVGILGLIVPSVPRWDGAKVEDLEFKHMADEAEKWVKVLEEEEKVDVIIATAHAGLESRHEEDGGDAAKYIAERCPEIDVLLLGHDHSSVNEEINGVLVAAPKSGKGNEIARFDLSLEEKDGEWEVVEKIATLIDFKNVENDEGALKAGEEFHEATLEFLSDAIGTSTGDFHEEPEIPGIPQGRIEDTAVVDIINQVQLEVTGADVSAAALFRSNSNLPEGELSYANIFDIYKFPNTLVGVEVTGKQLKEYMEWSASYYNTFKPGDLTISFNENIRDYNYDMFAGVDYKIDISKPAGERIVDLTLDGKPVEDEQVIKLAVNNYREGGLRTLGFITEEPYFKSEPISLRSYIKDFIKKEGTIDPVVDNNWELTGYEWDENARKLAVYAVNNGLLEIPTSEDGRTSNVRAITVDDLKEIGLNPENKYITIAHTNDTHGRLEEGKYDGMGFARIATKVDELRDIMGEENVIVLDGGDTLHGPPIATISQGESVAKVLNAIGYDAMAPGNHDFNYGQDRLLELSEILEFPVLAANVVKEDGTHLLQPYIIKEVNGLKVAIFGLATPETTYKTHPKNVEGLTFVDPAEAAEKMVAELENKADIIIAVSHLGVHEGNQTSEVVAEKVKGIDLIVDGHSHTELPEGKLVNGTWIVQAGEYDKNLGIVTLSIDKDGNIEVIPTLLDKEAGMKLEQDEEVLEIIAEIKEANDKLTSEKVGETDILLQGEREFVRKGETNMGNLITNAMLHVSGADIAITNGGGIRASIEPGEIIKKDIINVLPFGNQLVTLEATGQEILDALEVGIDEYPSAKGSFPHIAGMTMKFDPSKEGGNRVVEVLVDGKPIDPAKTYVLATNDFMAAGGDNYVMFKGKVTNEFQALDEVVMQYIAEKGFEGIEVSGRVTAVEATEEVVYVVQDGDTLAKIAYKHGTTYQELAELNDISNPHMIFVGQELLVPAN